MVDIAYVCTLQASPQTRLEKVGGANLTEFFVPLDRHEKEFSASCGASPALATLVVLENMYSLFIY